MGNRVFVAASVAAILSSYAAMAGAACESVEGTPIVLRSASDTRIMQTHRSSNDGAAGLIWLKRGPHVRGIVGFDLTGVDLDEIGCAALELTVYDGKPTKNGSWFSAHRMNAGWVEGNQSFNRLRVNGTQLGSHGGTGEGTTWDCRVDADLASGGTSDCSTGDRWLGGEDCGGGPCYSPSTDDYLWADKEDPFLSFDVTSDVVNGGDEVSWLLKVRDETSKSGSVKFYTRDGAAFVGLVDPDAGASAIDLGPRLLLYDGDGPTDPPSEVGSSHLCYDSAISTGTEEFLQVRSLALDDGDPRLYDVKRVRSLCVPASVEGAPDAPNPSGRISYDVRRSPGQTRTPDRKDVAVHDALGSLVVDVLGVDALLTTATIARNEVPAAPSGNALHLCHRAKATSSSADFSEGVRVHVTDEFEDRIYDVKKPVRLCLAAAVGGIPPAAPDAHVMCYKVVRADGEPKHEKVIDEIATADRFGELQLDTRVEEELCLPAVLVDEG